MTWTFHTISWDMVGWFRFGLGLVGLVHGMQQVRNPCACFGYRWDAYERWSFFATGGTLVSWGPLIIVGNLRAWSCLDII
jgi:hypothetical protein